MLEEVMRNDIARYGDIYEVMQVREKLQAILDLRL